MRAGDVAGDGEAQAGAAFVYVAGFVEPHERLEHLLAHVGRNAWAVIVHVQQDAAVRRERAFFHLAGRSSNKGTDALIALVNDKQRDIAAQAAPGLGKIGDDRARKPLLDQLQGATVEEKKVFLDALRDGIGTAGWGEQMESVLHHAILAFLESSRGGTIGDLKNFLLDPATRAEAMSLILGR